ERQDRRARGARRGARARGRERTGTRESGGARSVSRSSRARRMTTPLAEYRRRIESGAIAADPAQEKAVAALQRLYAERARAGGPPRGWRRVLARLFGQHAAPVRGLYLWGGVGRGKTFMMDLFYGALPFDDKLRRHFHRFMADVHEHLKELRD